MSNHWPVLFITAYNKEIHITLFINSSQRVRRPALLSALRKLLECVGAFHAVLAVGQAASPVFGPGVRMGAVLRPGKAPSTATATPSLLDTAASPESHSSPFFNHGPLIRPPPLSSPLCRPQEDPLEWDRRQKLVLGLQDMLSAVVEYWCGEHSKLNRCLVEKGLDDLAEHIAILCQGESPETRDTSMQTHRS